jgi:hypothetical protein
MTSSTRNAARRLARSSEIRALRYWRNIDRRLVSQERNGRYSVEILFVGFRRSYARAKIERMT